MKGYYYYNNRKYQLLLPPPFLPITPKSMTWACFGESVGKYQSLSGKLVTTVSPKFQSAQSPIETIVPSIGIKGCGLHPSVNSGRIITILESNLCHFFRYTCLQFWAKVDKHSTSTPPQWKWLCMFTWLVTMA